MTNADAFVKLEHCSIGHILSNAREGWSTESSMKEMVVYNGVHGRIFLDCLGFYMIKRKTVVRKERQVGGNHEFDWGLLSRSMLIEHI